MKSLTQNATMEWLNMKHAKNLQYSDEGEMLFYNVLMFVQRCWQCITCQYLHWQLFYNYNVKMIFPKACL